jgi:predicted lipoprotein
MRTPAPVLALLFGVATGGGCDGADPAPPPSTDGEGVQLHDGTVFTRRALLEAVGTCVLENARDFELRAQALDAAAAAASVDPGKRIEAQATWREAADRWQKLELLQIGPAAAGTQPGGADLRDAIYAWPLASACTVDAHIVAETWVAAPDDVLINARGLAAAEYLLFHDAPANACAADDPINTGGAWSALDDATLSARRAEYATFVAADLAEQATALVRAWDPAQGNFLGELAGAGDGSKTFTRQSIALNASSDALFYVDWATKDLKVGRPAGITQCDAAVCPEAVESLFAHRSKEHVRNNLLGLRMLFTGCGEDAKSLGFDDFLYAVGQGDLGASIYRDIVAALAAADAIDEADLAQAVATDHASVVALHGSLKRITDVLRTDLVTLLDLELPKRVEGDND